MIKVGIIGGSGYTAGELIRILLHHSKVTIDFVYSTSHNGKKISSIHQDLVHQTTQEFTQTVNPNVDVVFLCLGHGNSGKFLSTQQFSEDTIFIDLSNEFRLKHTFQGKSFVYGLPEIHKTSIKTASAIANPGCFATAIQLALLPLAHHNLLKSDVHINAVTGATGAGVMPSPTTHFAWRTANYSYYKPFKHQHLDEILQTIQGIQSDFKHQLFFIPNRGNFSRGIFATLYTHFEGDLSEVKQLYSDFYAKAPYTHIVDQPLHLKQVVNTNNCLIHLHKYQNQLLITSCIDNLLKGASGQAVQNMNLHFGFNETEGLQLKSSYF